MGLLHKHYLPTPRGAAWTAASHFHAQDGQASRGWCQQILLTPPKQRWQIRSSRSTVFVQKPGRNYILNNDWYYYYYRVPHCHCHNEQYKITSILNRPRTVIIIQIHSLEPLRQVHLVSAQYFPLFSRPWLRRSADSPLPLCTPTRHTNTTYRIPGVDASDVCYRNILSFIFSHL